MTQPVKIEFVLEPDEDGYPPVGVERVWATPLSNGNYLVDNIPFFITGISPEDEVAAAEGDGGVLRFRRLVRASGISTFRVIPSDLDRIQAVRMELQAIGARCEVNGRFGLIAVEVPAAADIQPILRYLVDGKSAGIVDFEEAALRHAS